MPIKIFAAPGDHRNDFSQVEQQFNEWVEQHRPQVLSIHPLVNEMTGKQDIGAYMMTLVAHFDSASG